MQTLADLRQRLLRLDGRGYKSYREIRGEYAADGFTLLVDHVQGDPFAEPSRLRAILPAESAGLPPWSIASTPRRIAAADFLNRALAEAFRATPTPRHGSGRSGELYVLRPGQEILSRTALHVRPDASVEARFRAGLPARGRTIHGRAAADLLCNAVPAAIRASLRFAALDPDALRRHVETAEDAASLRAQLADHGLVAFVADGAILPRRSGVDDRPLPHDRARPFTSPASLRVTLHRPNGGPITGLGIPAGVTLIVGGGYHGKSTLLRALERGVYDHIPGDGREFVVTIPEAVKVRAEDGRAVAGTDVSNFIAALPDGTDTRRFITRNASGSTSQAAAIVEALEVGARCLLLDEDTSATNLLIRDARMQALIEDRDEPITPLIDRIRTLARDHGVSTILVAGGSGDYFDVADTVIAMRDYEPADVTAQARAIAAAHPTARRTEGGSWRPPARRIPLPRSLDPGRGRRAVSIKVWSEDRALYGTEEVDLRAIDQIVEPAQVRAIAAALAWGRGRVLDGRADIARAIQAIMAAIDAHGLDIVQAEPTGDLASFRAFELAAFLNRIRGLETAPS